jgi:hypothetical protein
VFLLLFFDAILVQIAGNKYIHICRKTLMIVVLPILGCDRFKIVIRNKENLESGIPENP